MANDDRIKETSRREAVSWQTGGYNKFLARTPEGGPTPAEYMGGANFDALLDDMLFNRMIKLKDLRQTPQGNEPGKIYWDGTNKKYKIWVDATGQWADVQYTSTSTTTSSTSSSSSSTSSTSSSSSTSSTSSS